MPPAVIRLPRRSWLGLVGLAALPGPARAHAILVESDPKHEAEVPAGERVLRFRFNSRIDRARSQLTLTGADKVPTVLPLLPGPDDVLSARATLVRGRATLRWQVLAIDGHITRGDVPFTVTGG
jgi:methionine-rich copper-binding protein CopC